MRLNKTKSEADRKAREAEEAAAKAENKVVDDAPNPKAGRGVPYKISDTTTKQDN